MMIWLLYDDPDYALNTGFAQLMRERGRERGLDVRPVCLSEIKLGMDAQGQAVCWRDGKAQRPQAVFSRQRDALVSRHFEAMGVPVFNNARVCRLCNDKRLTLQFLHGLPMPRTVFIHPYSPPPSAFPVVVKPATSHGGDRVTLVRNAWEWRAAIDAIAPLPALEQELAGCPGRDLRVYVVHGRLVAGVMRTAREGIVSNFKRGGQVALHALTQEERALAQAVVERFAKAGAPLTLAGVDLLYGADGPMVGEVEDVVGSRMLYQTSDIDIVSLFLDGVGDAFDAGDSTGGVGCDTLMLPGNEAGRRRF